MISGFLMDLILNNGKYEKGSYGYFILNRVLRLFPIYWVVVLLTIFVSLVSLFVTGNPLKLLPYMQISHLSIGTWLLVAWSNIFILGQDLIMFLGLDSQGSLHFTNNFMRSSPPVYTFMLDSPAWSLSIELMFYIVAPYLVRKKSAILLTVCGVSLLVRFLLYQRGLYNDPWSYRFFPSEILFFLVGALGHRAYDVFKIRQLPKTLMRVAFGIVIAYTVLYQFVPGGELVRQVGYYVCFALSLPLIFALTKDNEWMNSCGEYSYPLYISHLLVLIVLPGILLRLHLSLAFLPYFLLLVTLVLASLLNIFVGEPVEKMRYRLVSAMKKRQATRQLTSV